MKQKNIFFGIGILSVLTFNNCLRKDDFPVLEGPYLGQKPPDLTPKIFAPDIVSTGFREGYITFAPGGKELYFILGGAPYNVTVCMKEENGNGKNQKLHLFQIHTYWN